MTATFGAPTTRSGDYMADPLRLARQIAMEARASIVGGPTAASVGEGPPFGIAIGSCASEPASGWRRRGWFEANLQTLDFAEPAFAFGFDDADFEVVVDLFEPGPLGGVRSKERTTDTCAFMNARRGKRSRAGSDGHLPLLEMGQERIPLFVGRRAVFFAGSNRPAPRDESTMCLNGFRRVDGLVAHGRIDALVPTDDLGDVRRQAVHDGVGDESSGNREG